MGEWTSYRLEDLLLFAPATYYRLFELHNAALWPLHPWLLLAGALAVALAFAARHRPERWLQVSAPSLALVLLALIWIGVGVGFHWHRYADINWAAHGFGSAFIGEAVLLAIAAGAAFATPGAAPAAPGRVRRAAGAVLALAGLLLLPGLGLFEGRSWRAAEWFGAAPDPTVLATLGVLLMLPAPGAGTPQRWLLRLCWPVPLAWCAITGATLTAMEAAMAPLLPLAGLAALAVALLRR